MSRRLTVIQTLPALDSGGVERGTLEIARALVVAGHRSIVVSRGGRLVAQLQAEGPAGGPQIAVQSAAGRSLP